MATLYQSDARDLPLPDKSVHCCVTSPPYWGLRDYRLGQWQGGDSECDHEKPGYVAPHKGDERGNYPGYTHDKQEPWPNGVCGHCGAVQQSAGIGLEPTLGEWVSNIVAVGREVWRVLRDDGTWWLNLGDAYDENKNCMGQPWRVAFALEDEGWIRRSPIVWHKPNPMPESVRDRPTNAYEMVFLLTKRGKYFYDAEAVREPLKRELHPPQGSKVDVSRNDFSRSQTQTWGSESGANARNVWTIPTQGRPDAHFATFPDELPRRCILAGTSERGVCADCGAPWARQTEKHFIPQPNVSDSARIRGNGNQKPMDASNGWDGFSRGSSQVETLGWEPSCQCNGEIQPATVLDPFAGSGTTLAVAQELGRGSVGIDLNPEYLALARGRINKANGITLPMMV